MISDSPFETEISTSINGIVENGSHLAPRPNWDQVISRSRVVVPIKKERARIVKNYKFVSAAASIVIIAIVSIALFGTLGERSPRNIQTTTDKNKVDRSTPKTTTGPDGTTATTPESNSQNSDTTKGSTNTTTATTATSAPTQTTTPTQVSSFLVSTECGVSTSESTYTLGSNSKFTAVYNKTTDQISITKHAAVSTVLRNDTSAPVAVQIKNAAIGETITYDADGLAVIMYFASSADPSGYISFVVDRYESEPMLAIAPLNGDGSSNFNFLGHSWQSPPMGGIVLSTTDYSGMRYYGSNTASGVLYPLNKFLIGTSPDDWADLGYEFTGLDQVIKSEKSGSGYSTLAGFDIRNVGCIMTSDFR